MAMVCVFVLKWATLNFEQVSEAAGWRQTGKHVCIGSVLNGLEREREASASQRTNASSMFYLK